MGRQRRLGPGCAFVALLALLLPSLAGANAFDAGGFPASISTEQVGGGPVLTVEAGKVECEEVTMTGTLGEASETLALTPAFSECSAFGFLEATVNPEGCQFVLQAGAEIAANEFGGTAGISCPAGKAIKIAPAVAINCEAQVGSQSGLSSMKYIDNTGSSPEDLTAQANLGGIEYTVTKDSFFCPFNGTGEKSGGQYSDTAVVDASTEEGGVFLAVRKPTKLCSKSLAQCPGGETYAAGNVVGALKAGTSTRFAFSWEGLPREPKCQLSSFNGTTAAASGTPLLGTLTGFGFAECDATCAMGAKNLDYRMEFRATGGGDGTLTLVSSGKGEPEIEINCPPVLCRYEWQFWRLDVKGGNPAELAVNEKLARDATSSKECGNVMTWTGTYTFTEPKPLYVTN